MRSLSITEKLMPSPWLPSRRVVAYISTSGFINISAKAGGNIYAMAARMQSPNQAMRGLRPRTKREIEEQSSTNRGTIEEQSRNNRDCRQGRAGVEPVYMASRWLAEGLGVARLGAVARVRIAARALCPNGPLVGRVGPSLRAQAVQPTQGLCAWRYRESHSSG